MAEVRDKPLEELAREITCAVCQGHYQKAKLLPCNHYYCGTCIEKLAERSRGKPFDCPECRKETRLPPGGVAELQSAFFVERMKDVYAKMAKAEGKMEAVCEQCVVGGKSVAFCRQCTEFICADCVRSHQLMKSFTGHVVASLEGLQKGGIKNVPLKVAPPLKCHDHDKSLKIFCFDCDHLICRDCTIIDHNGHNFNFLKKCAPESRKTLRDSLAPLQKVQADIAGAEKTLISEEAKVDTQKIEVCECIEESFERLKDALNQRKAELVKNASTLAQEKKDALAAQQKRFQVAQTEIQLVVELVERNIESTSDQDLMCIHKQLQTKMEEEEKRHQQLSLEPTATADIFCNLPSPDTIPKDLGTVSSQAIPALQQNVKSCELGASMQVSLVAPTATLVDISAHLKCVANPSSSLQGDVIEKGVGIYSITHTPQVRGRHDLIVKVKDKEIDGSPFRVVVEIPPTQLGQPVHQIEGLSSPWGIAINSKQQLVVAESGGKKITIMERDGKKVQTIECDKFQNPRGVAAGPDGAIYVTDDEAHFLFKFDTKGSLLKTVCNELLRPYSIKIIQNQLYVADKANSVVKIFDLDCNVVGSIETEFPYLWDIAQGPDGLYMAGGQISVYECAPNGSIIHQLNIQPSSLNVWGISFDNSGHIIATDHDSGVYVLTSNGECVGHVDSDVNGPSGVAVDEDGFVYVCGFWSDNIVLL